MARAHITDSFEDQDVSEYVEDTGKAFIESGGVEGSYHLELDTSDNDSPRIVSTSGLGDYPARGENFSVYMRDNAWDGAFYFGWEDSNNWYRVATNDTYARIQLDKNVDGSYTGNIDPIGTDIGSGWHEFRIDFGDPTITIEVFDPNDNSLGTITHDDTQNNGTGIAFQTIGRDPDALPQYDFDALQTNDPPPSPTISVSGHDADSISLSWSETKYTDSYNIYRAQASGSSTTDYTQVDSKTSTGYTDTGLEDGERYYYRVTAENTNGESAVSNEVAQTTDLPAATIDAVDTSVEREISVSWSLNDDSSDGEVEVYRSTDGSLGSLIADGLALSTTSYTDTGLADGERYYYTIRRVTDHATADTQDSGVTILPAPTSVTVDGVTGDQISISWTDNANNGDYRVLVSDDGGSTWTTDGDNLGASATSYQTTNLLDGELYTLAVEVYTEHVTSRDTTSE